MALLDVVLGYDCNLSCTYCTITEGMRRRALSTSQVAWEIERAASKGFRDVAFTGGEPTIRDDLIALVRFAKKRGFEHVKVASNGLRYAHGAYLDRLVEAGVDQFHVSMHAVGDAAYEETVQREGTAALRREAIANLIARKLDPIADLILKEDTYRDARAWVEGLHALGIARFRLWLVSLTDKNQTNVEQLPRLPAVAEKAIEAFEAGKRGGFEVLGLHIPRCFLPGYEEHVRHPGADRVMVLTPDEVFELRDSRLTGGVKPPGCAGCKFEAVCPGLRPDYVERFGGDEVRAVGAGSGSGSGSGLGGSSRSAKPAKVASGIG